jgi:hypothetical protein
MGGLVSLFGAQSSTLNQIEVFLPQNGEEVIIFNIKLNEQPSVDHTIPQIIPLTDL